MHIEYLQTKSPKPGGKGMPSPQDVEQYLLKLPGTMHDDNAVRLFSSASTWAYSDLKVFASMMSNCGLYGEFVSICVTNDSVGLDTSAYLFLSHDKQLAILTFRGPEPDNSFAWLNNANARMQEGGIHGDMLASKLVVVPVLRDLLLGWSESSTSLAEGLEWVRENRSYPDGVFPTPPKKSKKKSKKQKKGEETDEEQTPALYICGHGLGGTYAAMCGAMIQLCPTLESLRTLLRSIYTFGAPMFADANLADTLDQELGKRVFRHRYRMDIFPLLPGLIQGRFKHFGVGYRSSWQGTWIRARYREDQWFGMLKTNLLAMLTLPKGRMAFMPWVDLPISWVDHSPCRYQRTSSTLRASWEMLTEMLGGSFPGKS
jgi:hypothetical protein